MSEPIQLQIAKSFKSPCARLFEAWTRANVMKQWLAPGELICTTAESDPRAGGSFTVGMEGTIGGHFTRGMASGTYRQVVPNELVSLTWNWAGDYQPPETLITVTFKDSDEGAEMLLIQEGFADEQHKINYAMGWDGAFEKLSRAVA